MYASAVTPVHPLQVGFGLCAIQVFYPVPIAVNIGIKDSPFVGAPARWAVTLLPQHLITPGGAVYQPMAPDAVLTMQISNAIIVPI